MNYLKRKIVLVIVLFACSQSLRAQEAPIIEIFAGYTHQRPRTNEQLNGSAAAVSVNGLDGLVGLVGEIDVYHYKIDAVKPAVPVLNAGVESLKADARVIHAQVGPRVYYRPGKASVFGHALVGAAKTSLSSIKAVGWSASGVYTPGWIGELTAGGGIDYQLIRRVAIRLAQFDYVYAYDERPSHMLWNQPIQHKGFRYSGGLVLRF